MDTLTIDAETGGWQPRLPIALVAKGAPRISPTNADVIEIECVFAQFPMGRRQSIWMPLSEVMGMPLGHVVYRGSMDIERPPLMRWPAQGFVPRCSASGVLATHTLAGVMPTSKAVASQTFQKVDYWVDDKQPQPIAIGKSEYTRFVLGAFGAFSDDLLDLDIDPDLVFAKYCDLSRTGLDGSVFHIAPHSNHPDYALLAEIAILKTEPDYLDALRRFGRALRIAMLNEDNVLPDIVPPALGSNLKLGIEKILPTQLTHGTVNQFPDAIIASRVISDRRKLKFERTIIDVDYSFENAPHEGSDPGDPKPPRPGRPMVGPRTKFDNTVRPNSRLRPYVFSTGSLFSSFTGLEKHRFETRAGRAMRRHNGASAPPRPPSEIDQLSTLPAIGDGKARRVRFNQTVPPDARRELPKPRVEQDRFLQEDTKPATILMVDFASLDARLSVFSEAANVLERWASLDGSMSAKPRSNPAIVQAFEWTREHGTWAWSVKHGRGRRMLVHTLLLGDARVLVGEIERLKAGETYAIGLMCPVAPASCLDDVARIVGQLGTRNSVAHDPGIWPPHVFEDIVFASLYHSAARNLPNSLAADIQDRAYELLKATP